MIKAATLYKDMWLAHNSDAYKLYVAKEWVKLDAHLKGLK